MCRSVGCLGLVIPGGFDFFETGVKYGIIDQSRCFHMVRMALIGRICENDGWLEVPDDPDDFSQRAVSVGKLPVAQVQGDPVGVAEYPGCLSCFFSSCFRGSEGAHFTLCKVTDRYIAVFPDDFQKGAPA